MRMESVRASASARVRCILSRPSAEPRCVSPVPVTVRCGGVLVVDRIEHAALLERGGEIHRLADAAIGDELAQRRARFDRLMREFERRARALDEAAFASRGDDQRALAGFVDDLRQSHALSLFPSEGAIGPTADGECAPARRAHIVAPICHGTNSASPYPKISDLDFSPEATARTLSKISWPFSAIETPSSTSPQLMSMSSIMRW